MLEIEGGGNAPKTANEKKHVHVFFLDIFTDILIAHYVFDFGCGYVPSSLLVTCRSEISPEVKWNPVEATIRVYVIPFSSCFVECLLIKCS